VKATMQACLLAWQKKRLPIGAFLFFAQSTRRAINEFLPIFCHIQSAEIQRFTLAINNSLKRIIAKAKNTPNYCRIIASTNT
jgi:hypothetical protein